MGVHGNHQAMLRERALAHVADLSAEDREALLLKCWMSHDARWYMVAAREFGIDVANRMNQAAARDEGRVEAHRCLRALGLEPPRTRDEALVAQEALASLLTRDLVEYEITPDGDDAFEFRVGRCFAHENVTRASIADQYDCGIFSRVQGWWDAFGLQYELDPLPGRCLRDRGRECVYAFRRIRPAEGA